MTHAVACSGVVSPLLIQGGSLWLPAASSPGRAGVFSALNGSEVRHNAAIVIEAPS